MPDAPHDKLSYTRGVLEKIRASYDKLSRDELLDLICYVSKTYIVEQTIPYDLPIPEREDEAPEPMAEPAILQQEQDRATGAPRAVEAEPTTGTPTQRFAQLIEGLKKRTQLPQLEQFTIEEGRAVLTVDNQKIVFGDRVTVEFVPVRGRRVTETPPTAAPRPTPAAPGQAPAPTPVRPPVEAPPAGARPGLPGGDGRMRQGGGRPGPFEPERRPAPGVPAPQRPGAASPPSGGKDKPKDKGKPGEGNLADVDHIVERFKRLDLD